MAVVFRGPLYVSRRELAPVHRIGSPYVQSQLITLLRIAGPPLPLGAAHSFPLQGLSKPRVLNADTTRGTAKVLLPDATPPKFVAPWFSPSATARARWLPADTSIGEPLTLRSIVTQSPFVNAQYAAPPRLRYSFDTSTGAYPVLFPKVAAAHASATGGAQAKAATSTARMATAKAVCGASASAKCVKAAVARSGAAGGAQALASGVRTASAQSVAAAGASAKASATAQRSASSIATGGGYAKVSQVIDATAKASAGASASASGTKHAQGSAIAVGGARATANATAARRAVAKVIAGASAAAAATHAALAIAKASAGGYARASGTHPRDGSAMAVAGGYAKARGIQGGPRALLAARLCLSIDQAGNLDVSARAAGIVDTDAAQPGGISIGQEPVEC